MGKTDTTKNKPPSKESKGEPPKGKETAVETQKSKGPAGEPPKVQAAGKPPKAQAAGEPPKAQAAGEPPKAQAAGEPPKAQAAGEPPKVQAAGEPPKVQAEEKPKSASAAPPSAKAQGTPSVGKDAFGRPTCNGEKEGHQCHESHKGFQVSSQTTTKKEPKATKKFAEVDSEKIEGRSTIGKITDYCQNLVRREGAVEQEAVSSVASGPSVTRGRATGFLGQQKLVQLMVRWLPAAGLYVVTTAAVAAWVTEWGPVVNRIPFYKDKEPKEVPSPDEMLAPETPLQELPPGFENVVPKDPQGSHPAEGSETVESSSLPAESELPPEMPASSEESSDPPAAEAPVPAAGTGT